MSPTPLRKRFRGTEERITACPNCGKQHKWGRAGDYCNMTCYYAKLTKEGVYDGRRG